MEYLTFRKLITPIIIQVIFWIAVVVVVISGIVALTQGNLSGIALIILGPIVARVYAELLIVIFNIEREVRRISGVDGASPPGVARVSPTTPQTSG
jgi:uncharacterized protein DUF4282